MFISNEFHSINVIPPNYSHGITLSSYLFSLGGVTPTFVPIHLNTIKCIGGNERNNMKKTKYVKMQDIEQPLEIRRNKLWSYKAPFSNTYRGKSYNGFVEFYINEPHLIDLTQSWYQPTITVRCCSGINATFDFTWEQFEQSPFYDMVNDLEMAYCTYNYVCTDYIDICTNYIKDG